MNPAIDLPLVDAVRITRALLSVSDKTDLVPFATALQREFGVELLSTGGTAAALRAAGLAVTEVSDHTGFPEMLDGRVKTLHPKIHGGLLGLRDKPDHQKAMAEHQIAPIDLLVVNLYPFEQTVARPEVTFAEAIENIDIGGPAMIRSAAKNHRSVAVVTDSIQYDKLLKHMRANAGATPYRFRLDLALWAFTNTAAYDAAISAYLGRAYFDLRANAEKHAGDPPPYAAERAGLTPTLQPHLVRQQILRYGENPHQRAAFYATPHPPAGIATARQLHGIELSYINLLDADAAIELVREFTPPAAAIIKHTNPCGCAIADTLADAFDRAYAGDPVAAFGCIVALNRNVDVTTAERIISGKRFLHVLIAPSFDAEALCLLQGRWKDCRLLATGDLDARRGASAGAPHKIPLHLRSVTGGVLAQQMDNAGFDRAACVVGSRRTPTDTEWRDLEFIWLVTKHVKSNAVCVAKDGQLLGAGAGQMSRPMSARIAIDLARQNGHAESLAGSVAGSDAFFPFPDAPQLLIDAGITAIIHPGGSKKDQETIDACDRHGIALVTTGQRHFRH